MEMNFERGNVTALLAIAVLGILYLFQINFMVSNGYKMRDVSQSIEGIKKQAKRLELESLDLQSMQKIKEQANSLGLVSGNHALYVSAEPPVVAFQ